MQSEEKTDKGRLAVGLAILNAVKKDRSKIPGLLLHAKNPDANNHFGVQIGRYAATDHPPTARTLQLAEAIQAGRVPDFSDGAKQWDSPQAQDHGHQLYLKYPKKFPGYKFTSAEIEAKRVAEGRRVIHIPGIPDTRFWA
jgi:hypothetical protein